MSSLVATNKINKRVGATMLFEGLTFNIQQQERLGIIGPNGAGKSTLMRIISGSEDIDAGEITKRRDLRISYIAQVAKFDQLKTPLELARIAASGAAISEVELETLARESLAQMQIEQQDVPSSNLSGGQQKRLQIALALCEQPELLLLDEPTNHLDIESILALEALLKQSNFAWVIISHDRWFLENSVTRIAEINSRYPGGYFSSNGGFADYMRQREEFLATEEKRLDSLANKVRTETAWLRQGAKARTTKSRHRTDRAYSMMDDLSLVRARSQTQSVGISFQGSERKTKRLLEFTNVSFAYGETPVFSKLDLKLLSGQALGVLGLNGSGKSTFAQLVSGELSPLSGTIKRAQDLSVSYFRQFDNSLVSKLPLKQILAEDGDSVIFQGRSLHVASWAKRFNFKFEQLVQPYDTLSGGEQARARIARIMLQSPDLLILDEPTNDLDIDTLEMLEQSLVEFSGALILITHDRFMINRVCNTFLGLDASGQTELYADYEQWERAVLRPEQKKSEDPAATATKPAEPTRAKRLSYNEQRELNSMEERILKAESEVEQLQQQLSEFDAANNAEQLAELCRKLDQMQKQVESLYQRWQELTSTC